MNVEIVWYGLSVSGSGLWDCAEVTLETAEYWMTVSPYIGEIAGPDGRWIASLDVPDGTGHGIRPLFPPVICDCQDAAVEAVETMINYLAAEMRPAAVGESCASHLPVDAGS